MPKQSFDNAYKIAWEEFNRGEGGTYPMETVTLLMRAHSAGFNAGWRAHKEDMRKVARLDMRKVARRGKG